MIRKMITRLLVLLGLMRPSTLPPPTVAANPPPTDPPRGDD